MPGRMQMRTINTELITQQVKEMCMDVNIHLSKDVKCAIEEAEGRISTWKADIRSAGRKYGDCFQYENTNLSGYRYDRCIFESWTRGSF